MINLEKIYYIKTGGAVKMSNKEKKNKQSNKSNNNNNNSQNND